MADENEDVNVVDPDETVAPEVTEVSGDWVERAMEKHATENPDGVTESKKPDVEPQDTPPADKPPVEPVVKPVVEEPKVEQPPKVEVQPPKDPEDLQKFLAEKPPEKISKNAAQAFEKIKTSSAEMIRARDETIRKANQEVTDAKKIIADMNAQMATLKKLQAVVDYQTDPEFVNKYEKPIADKEAEMVEWLKEIGVDDAGIAEFNKGKKSDKFLADVAAQISEKNPGLGELYRQHMMELRTLRRTHTAAVKDVQTNHEKFFEERKNASSVKKAEFETQREAALTEAIGLKMEDGSPRLGFLNKKEIPVNATPEQKKQIESHNDAVEKNLKTVREWASAEDPGTRLNNAIGMMQAILLSQNVVPNMMKRIKELETQLTQFKGATRLPQRLPTKPGDPVVEKPRNWDDAFAEVGYSDKV